jgi:hypothetical protein
MPKMGEDRAAQEQIGKSGSGISICGPRDTER